MNGDNNRAPLANTGHEVSLKDLVAMDLCVARTAGLLL